MNKLAGSKFKLFRAGPTCRAGRVAAEMFQRWAIRCWSCWTTSGWERWGVPGCGTRQEGSAGCPRPTDSAAGRERATGTSGPATGATLGAAEKQTARRRPAAWAAS